MRPSIIATLSLTFGIVVGFSAQKYFDPAPKPGRDNQKSAGPAQTAQPSKDANPPAAPSSSLDLYTSVAQVQRDDLPELAKKILALSPDSPHRAAALDLLMERWAAIDAEGALSFAKTLFGSDRDAAFKSALLRLGTTGFSHALNWLGENTSGSTRKNAQIWLYTGLARNDPQAALRQIENLKPGGLKDDALFTVVSDWAQRDVHAAFAWYKTAPWSEKMPFIDQRLMYSYMLQDPRGTQKLIAQLDDKNYW